MAAGVLFVILVQRHPKNTKTSTYYLEIAKSSLSTALWLWLFLDSIFGPYDRYYSRPEEYRLRKIIQAALCFFVLPLDHYYIHCWRGNILTFAQDSVLPNPCVCGLWSEVCRRCICGWGAGRQWERAAVERANHIGNSMAPGVWYCITKRPPLGVRIDEMRQSFNSMHLTWK